jgi:hypothetical protein
MHDVVTHKFREIAKSIVVSREVFRQQYDTVVALLPLELRMPFIAVAKLHEPDNLGLSGRAKDEADFAAALTEADQRGLLPLLFARYARQWFVDDEQANVSLQAVVNLREVFHGGLDITLGRMSALRRTCRIICLKDDNDPEKGSGFLIGPHLVLTNWHVVRAMLDGGREAPRSHERIRIEFDALLPTVGPKQYRPLEKWLVASSEAHEHETAAGGRGVNPWPERPDELAGKLDFAVIALDDVPGEERGWYDIGEAPWPTVPNLLDVFQFPMGRTMACMGGKFVQPVVFTDNARPARVLHTANTEKGSSGGLCLDHASQAVALHQAGYRFRNALVDGRNIEVSDLNAAVPLVLVFRAAGQAIKRATEAAPQVKRWAANGVPIIGRGRFQRLIHTALRGENRILTVQTSFDPVTRKERTKIGKSFSQTIMEALLPSEHAVLVVPAARLTTEAYKAAQEIVQAVRSDFLPRLPAQPSLQTSLDADALGALVTPVIEAMKSGAGNGLLWLIIDDLDRSPVMSESTTATFLNALYTGVIAEKKLRIVLIGPTAVLPVLRNLPAGIELLDEITDDDVGGWIEAELRTSLPILPEMLRFLVAVARSMSDELIKGGTMGRTCAVAQVINNHWAPSLKRVWVNR